MPRPGREDSVLTMVSRAGMIAGAATAAGALWLALAGTLPATVGQASPGIALAVRPSAAALAARGETRLKRNGVNPAAIADARAALARDPTSVKAMRVLIGGAVAGGRQVELERLLAYSESLSRRDLATEVALIEQKVAGGDVRGALVHYDRALRTNRSASTLLIPVLVQATADPQVTPALAALVARRPIWWRTLASSMLGDGPQVAAIPAIFRAIRLDPAKSEEASLLAEALGRLVASGRPSDAAGLLGFATGRTVGNLRNGGFDDAAGPALPPFDWSLTDDPDLSATIEPAPEMTGGRVLTLTALRKAGVAARQLVMFAPGRYRLSFAAGALPADASSAIAAVTLRCADRMDATLASLPLATAATGVLTIPGGCAAQWLSIEVTAPVDGAATPWIDDIRVSPLRG